MKFNRKLSNLSKEEPLGGQPAKGTKPSVKNLEDQVAYQRAFEAVVWSQPAVAVYGIRRGMLDGLGMKDNEVMAMSKPLTTRHEFLTANNTTPYIVANADLQKGAVVVEIPAAKATGVIYGQVVDAWQVTIADVGPSGLDQGNGGKYLFLPPGYKGDVPKVSLLPGRSRTKCGLGCAALPLMGTMVQRSEPSRSNGKYIRWGRKPARPQ